MLGDMRINILVKSKNLSIIATLLRGIGKFFGSSQSFENAMDNIYIKSEKSDTVLVNQIDMIGIGNFDLQVQNAKL